MRGFWAIKCAARAMQKRLWVPRFKGLDRSRRAEPTVVVAIHLTVPLKAGEPHLSIQSFVVNTFAKMAMSQI